MSLWTLNGHKPVIPVVIFPTPLTLRLRVQRISRTIFRRCSACKRPSQASFSPCSLRFVSVESELTIVQVGYSFRPVPPQPSSPAGDLWRLGHRTKTASTLQGGPKAPGPTSLHETRNVQSRSISRATNLLLMLHLQSLSSIPLRAKLNRVFFPHFLLQARFP